MTAPLDDRELAQRFMQEADEGEDSIEELLKQCVSFCRAHFQQEVELSIQLELPKSWHFKCIRCGSEQDGKFKYARTPITSENCIPRINELLSDCVEVLGAFPESKGKLHDALVTSITNYLLPPAKEASPIPADMVPVPREPTENVRLNIRHRDCHKAADAFWKYWKENGETHKNGYYEATWGAINSALKVVGVIDTAQEKPND